jgi:hypothetical protein
MEKGKLTETSWQNELMDYIHDDFENQILKIAIDKIDPEGILQSVKEIIKEKLHEDKKSED